METKKKFEAPEIKLVDLKAGAALLAGSFVEGVSVQTLGNVSFDWSTGTLS